MPQEKIEDNANAKVFIYLLLIFFFGGGGGLGGWGWGGRGANKVNLGDAQMGMTKYYFTLPTIIKGIYHATAFFRCGFR